MKRRDFFLGGAPAVIGVLSASSAAAEAHLMSGFGDLDILPYDAAAFMSATSTGPVVLVIDDGSSLSVNQFQVLSEVMEGYPGFIMPVFSLPYDQVESASETKDWDPAPGSLMVISKGFIEAHRSDQVSVSDLVFLFEAVLMNEGGKG